MYLFNCFMSTSKLVYTFNIFKYIGIILLVLQPMPCVALSAAETINGCLVCHANKAAGFSDKHGFASTQCTTCHKGDDTASDLPVAHKDLIGYPGDMEHARTACGNCHEKRVDDVTDSLMNTGKGMIDKTRHAFEEMTPLNESTSLKSLGHSPADSLLRKLCASCHLGNSKSVHALDVTRDRGGGCSACHINSYPINQHPALTSRVEDGRCFGCHSRSGRISLNYAGLAESLPSEQHADTSANTLQLADGRTVIRKPADAHYEAGMSCIDCHTSTGLMGGNDNTQHQQQAVDIQCEDCHRNASSVVTTARGDTPLSHISQNNEGLVQLMPKLGGPAIPIPAYTADSHPLSKEHERLHCSACHSQWAPQCYGCHIEYDPDEMQKDHLLQDETPGRWKEKRWDVHSGLPALGVTAENKIRPFVPGMIMTIEHPDWKEKKFKRLFAATEPHTTGRSRSCKSCHRSSAALGLGQGALKQLGGEWHYSATQDSLADGLPADAWTSFNNGAQGQSTQPANRAFNRNEMIRILNAPETKQTRAAKSISK